MIVTKKTTLGGINNDKYCLDDTENENSFGDFSRARDQIVVQNFEFIGKSLEFTEKKKTLTPQP